MPKTIVRENDTLDEALKRFKRDVSRSGTLVEARKRQHYMKPSDVRKEKRRAARKVIVTNFFAYIKKTTLAYNPIG